MGTLRVRGREPCAGVRPCSKRDHEAAAWRVLCARAAECSQSHLATGVGHLLQLLPRVRGCRPPDRTGAGCPADHDVAVVISQWPGHRASVAIPRSRMTNAPGGVLRPASSPRVHPAQTPASVARTHWHRAPAPGSATCSRCAFLLRMACASGCRLPRPRVGVGQIIQRRSEPGPVHRPLEQVCLIAALLGKSEAAPAPIAPSTPSNSPRNAAPTVASRPTEPSAPHAGGVHTLGSQCLVQSHPAPHPTCSTPTLRGRVNGRVGISTDIHRVTHERPVSLGDSGYPSSLQVSPALMPSPGNACRVTFGLRYVGTGLSQPPLSTQTRCRQRYAAHLARARAVHRWE